MDIGSKIKAIRKQLGISGNQLAKLAGIGQSTISDIENQKISPSVDTLQRICAALGISLANLFTEDDASFSPDLQLLIETAKKLTPEERKNLNTFLQTLLERTDRQ
ncbi:helix-turn-helix domain-containing protein [Anoxybacillus ayderensis]|uniref:helix-turn-helix domain-containing protein n=1 Tax=Anoxybacillus ayderensis TaxID=265546 RepID=UPI0003866AFC|nr:helix-turn-helix transcriptional regulator [Anoxybacillus ayderensis]EPZ37778.1 helix-turn-helix domain-containing protein [Anoxybacillus ayderensis]